ncbi:MAG TPA: hypothetical protein VGR53_04315 [Nitrososphaerales archaeon]|nr:hypothetical protein [Nitrososphaerales archaeon]
MPVVWPGYKFFDWRDLVLSDSRIQKSLEDLYLILDKSGLSVRVRNYVSTRGGELRDEVQVIAPEIRDLLGRIGGARPTLETTKPFRLVHFFSEASSIVHNSDGERGRELLYLRMMANQLHEEDIRDVISSAVQNGVTVSFDLKTSPAFKPDSQFDTFIKAEVLEPALAGLIKHDEMEHPATAPTVWPRQPPQKAFTLGESSDIGDFLKMYQEIGLIEIALRNVVTERMSTSFGPGWIRHEKLKGLVSNWEQRASDDERVLVEREPEPINYADFSEYGMIIDSFPKIFADVFPDAKAARLSIERINALGRRTVMHFRSLTGEKLNITNYELRFVRKALSKDLDKATKS